MRELAIIINFFIPGLGTLIVGKVGQGIAQLLLFIIGFFVCVISFFAQIRTFHPFSIMFVASFLICLAVWIWGLILVARMPASSLQPPASRVGGSGGTG